MDDRELIVRVTRVLSAYEKWEADLLLNADWSHSTPVMTQQQFDRLVEIQTMRNSAVAQAKGRAWAR